MADMSVSGIASGINWDEMINKRLKDLLEKNPELQRK